jgi:hypothetical protein
MLLLECRTSSVCDSLLFSVRPDTSAQALLIEQVCWSDVYDQASVSRWLKAATRQVTVEEITESTDLIYQLRAGEFTADGKLIEDVDESGCGSVEWTEKV